LLIWDIACTETIENSTALVDIDVSSTLDIRIVSGLNFSVDCKYLVVLGLVDRHMLVIFDVSTGEPIISTRLGHSEILQMGFNPYLFVSSTSTSGRVGLLRDSANEKNSCYTLVSCGGKQVKFWTFCEHLERTDLEIITGEEKETSRFKGRKLAIPRKKQQWRRKYTLEGNHASLSIDSPDMTCFCPVFEGTFGGVIPGLLLPRNCHNLTRISTPGVMKSRVLTGTSTGSIYIWEQIEEFIGNRILLYFPSIPPFFKFLIFSIFFCIIEPKPVTIEPCHPGDKTFWLPRGRLISIVTNVHDSAIVDLDYSGPASYEEGGADSDDDWVERVVSCCQVGTVSTWQINKTGDTKMTPFNQEACLSLSSIEGIGQPRCVSFNLGCSAVVIGTSANSICMLSGLGVNKTTQLNESGIKLDHVVTGHCGKIRKISTHPTAEVFVTISGDKTIRFWDFKNRLQLTLAKIVGKPTAVTFSQDGKTVVVGNEGGELIVLTHACINRDAPHLSPRANNDGWYILFRRSLGPRLPG
jgi:WD40 repeat protein